MNTVTDDELSGIPTTNSGKSTTPAAIPEDEEPTSPQSATSSLDVDFGDKKIMTKEGLKRGRPEKGKAMRFAFLPVEIAGKPKHAKSHFIDKKGNYRCMTKADEQEYCCRKIGEDGVLHIVAPIVRYLNADSETGGLEKGVEIKWELAYVDLTQSNYKKVCNLPDEDQSVYDIDIVMTHADRAFGYEFNRKSPKPRWALDPQVKADVSNAAQKMFLKDGGKRLISRLGKEATLAEWKNLLSGAAANNSEEVSLDSIEELS